jgi:dsRNA-specific ribonuclease
MNTLIGKPRFLITGGDSEGRSNQGLLGLATTLSREQAASVPTTVRQRTHETTNVEDDELEDLPREIVLKDLADDLVQKAIDLLNAFSPSTDGPADPVLAINMFYQKRGIGSIANFFEDHQIGNLFWTSFFCPIKGAEYTSGLPLPLFHPEPQDDRLVELAHKIFGRISIAKNQQVMFSSKRGARRAVAFAVLQAHQLSGIECNIASMIESEESGDETPDSSIPRNVNGKSYPYWVHQLHKLGVGSSSLEISYREFLPPSLPIDSDSWTPRPCQLCCILRIQKPKKLMVIGFPCTTKRLALDDAVTLLSEELQRQSSGPTFPPKVSLASIMRRNPSGSTYIIPTAPRWATTPITEGSKNIFLYRVRFLTTHGNDFVAFRSKLGLDAITPVGVVFADDLPEPVVQNGCFRAKFKLPSRDQKSEERVVVEISRLGKVNLPSQKPSSLDDMRRFNQKICSWKDYHHVVAVDSKVEKVAPSLLKRTYMFVPLTSHNDDACIDWKLLKRIAKHELLPYFKQACMGINMPCYGKVDFLFCSAVLALFGIACSTPTLWLMTKGLLIADSSGYLHVDVDPLSNTFGICLAILAILVLIMHTVMSLRPIRCLKRNMLQNCFIIERKHGPKPLYVTPSKDHFDDPLTAMASPLTARSPLYNREGPGPTESHIHNMRVRYNLDSRKATYAQLYKAKFGIDIKFPGQKLLNLCPIQKHTDHDFLFETERAPWRRVIPELCWILPMPRDVLYMLHHASLFMPEIEKAVGYETRPRQFYRSLVKLVDTPSSALAPTLHVPMELFASYEEATTIARFQRLEFLGDAVLGLFLAINLMALNSNLAWDIDDLTVSFTDAAKNSSLHEAALRIGANRLIQQTESKENWRSAYNTKENNDPMPFDVVHHVTRTLENDFKFITWNDKVLSDLVESLLGAAFLVGKADQSNHMRLLIGLFEALKLPIYNGHGKLVWGDTSKSWFQATSSCLNRGYNFLYDESWQNQIIEIGSALYSDRDVSDRLERGWKDLVKLLVRLSSHNGNLEEDLGTQLSKIMLFSSLFDDSLRDASIENESVDSAVDSRSIDSTSTMSTTSVTKVSRLRRFNSTGASVISTDTAFEDSVDGTNGFGGQLEHGLYRAALLRDTLYLVGSNALQLCLTHDLFNRYPKASEGDLHILRACSMCDDVVVYIMFKAGIHKCLFDQNASCISRFQSIVEIAGKDTQN